MAAPAPTKGDADLQRQFLQKFEGREAVYVEKGVIRVRISNVQLTQESMSAEVEALPTTGLPIEPSSTHRFRRARRWRITTSVENAALFSSHCWDGGMYSAWSLFFDPTIVAEVSKMAAAFPEDVTPQQRYNELLRFLYPRIRQR